jgi:Ca-activated chloride channel family protein
MTFAHPNVLLLLALLPLAAWLAVRQERRRQAALAAFGDPALLAGLAPLPEPRRRLLRYAIRLGALGLGLVALARPQLGERPATVARTGRDMLVVLDLSRSMNVADVAPTRLAAAKRIAAEIVSASPGDRVGFIVFGGSAFLQLPLTADRDAFNLFLQAASTDDIGDPSTDLGSALATAAKAFEHEGEHGAQAVLIVSDGESGEDDLDRPLDALKRRDIPVYAIGVGTPEGGPVPADTSEAPEPYHRDHIGRVVVSHLEERDLRRAAEATGGAYARADAPAAIREVSARLSRLATRTISTHRATKRADRFQWPLGAAVAALAIEPMIGVRRRRRR